MDYLTANETALKWDISSRMVAYYCKAGRIDGAVKKGKHGLSPLMLKNLLMDETVGMGSSARRHTGCRMQKTNVR